MIVLDQMPAAFDEALIFWNVFHADLFELGHCVEHTDGNVFERTLNSCRCFASGNESVLPSGIAFDQDSLGRSGATVSGDDSFDVLRHD